ncbi:MAG TPA: hypothetical protein VFZ44_03530 [Pyrinomonadaceae bacterium]
MNTLLLVCASALLCAGLFPQTSPGGAPKFSSAYTDLKTQCKPIAEGEPQGDDTPLRCAGHGGYEVRIDFSAASSHLGVQPAGGESEERIELATQPLNYDAKRKIEWRLAGGEPFAVIFRVDKVKDGLDPAEMWRPENKTGESLLVKGLKGYERINFEVDAKAPDANAKAREMADSAYAKGR